ncbi:MAG: cbb3-type cytochrome oxidase assembly protein CcoS [Cytophagaceae bacterium]|nr:cbb3-type cytochrome oxidase assembly protein CcoS [Cytophagaceae bacterium]MBK9508386.1 cbb3-type cytochrome oxidase assembly protein CcoS [Cytophagaceae bacterium]MBK9932821.1 cbb3-type cytochrome oxidase assembly protein CcoS [Cytophagaceae bacterium]MBL0303489.1 cbb3-type cytochrome oxidase assembly protein CcoS [Cytophagaceae bacterium]MBL0326315.1 cbb3-type cytochrome oxidase assembly protein CcoS [Cytophagaceae bacterium]
MEVIIALVILAILVAGGFLVAFFWATNDGQFDDTYSPSVRILIDNDTKQDKKH